MGRRATRLQLSIVAWGWQLDAACRDRAGAEFFHPDHDPGRISREIRESVAKNVCATCPVRPECATHALSAGERYGVWGGLTEADRARLHRKGWRHAIRSDGLVDLHQLAQL